MCCLFPFLPVRLVVTVLKVRRKLSLLHPFEPISMLCLAQVLWVRLMMVFEFGVGVTIRWTGRLHPAVKVRLCLLRLGMVTIVLALQFTSMKPVIHIGSGLLASGRVIPRLALTLCPLRALSLVVSMLFRWYLVMKVVILGRSVVIRSVSGRLVVIEMKAVFTSALGWAANMCIPVLLLTIVKLTLSFLECLT